MTGAVLHIPSFNALRVQFRSVEARNKPGMTPKESSRAICVLNEGPTCWFQRKVKVESSIAKCF